MSTKLSPDQAEKFWQCACPKKDAKELSIHDLKRGVQKYCDAQGCACPDDRHIVRMFQGIDRSGDNAISKEEFMTEMCERNEREGRFCKLFQELDKDGNGSLSREEIRKLFTMEKSGRAYSEDLIEQIIDDCDKNGDGVITYAEFKNECT